MSHNKLVDANWDFSRVDSLHGQKFCKGVKNLIQTATCPIRQAVYVRVLSICGVEPSFPDKKVVSEAEPKEGRPGGESTTGRGRSGESGPSASTYSRFTRRAHQVASRIRTPSEGFVYLSRLSKGEEEFGRLVSVLLMNKFSNLQLSKERNVRGAVFDWRPSLANMASVMGVSGILKPVDEGREAFHLINCFRPDVSKSFRGMQLHDGYTLHDVFRDQGVPGYEVFEPEYNPEVAYVDDGPVTLSCSVCDG